MISIFHASRLRHCAPVIRRLCIFPSPSLPNSHGGLASLGTATRTTSLAPGHCYKSHFLHQATPVISTSDEDMRNDKSHISEHIDDPIQPEVQEAWVEGKPTRAIASKLLDMPDHMAESHALYAKVNRSGLFRSRRHFKHCVKLMRSMKRVDMVCHGSSVPESTSVFPSESGAVSLNRSKRYQKEKLQFSIALTGRGRRVYSRLRRISDRNDQENTDPGSNADAASTTSFPSSADSKPSPNPSSGLSDAL